MGAHLRIFCVILFLAFGYVPGGHADSERDIAVDQAIAGMEEGSRMLASDNPAMADTALSPATDTKVIISPAAQTETAGPSLGDQAGTVEPATEPVIDVDAGIDTDSGSIEVDVGVNPEGDQLLDADAAGSEADADLTESGLESETQVDIGGAVDIPVEDDIGDPQEPTEETNPIIDIEADVDADSGTVDADVSIDPSGDELLDADLSGSGAGTTTDVETVIVEPPAGLSAEVDTTGETIGGETDIGIEADVSGTGAGEDIVEDPTDDGLGGL